MSEKPNGHSQWRQTIVVVIAIVTCTVSSSLWLQNKFHHLDSQILIATLEREALVDRVTQYGFSRMQAQRFVDDLRMHADHPVPTIAEWIDLKRKKGHVN